MRRLAVLLGTWRPMCGIRRSPLARGARCATVSGQNKAMCGGFRHGKAEVRGIPSSLRAPRAKRNGGLPHIGRHVPSSSSSAGGRCGIARRRGRQAGGTGTGKRVAPGPAGARRRRRAGGAVRRRARHAIKRSRKPAGSPHDDGRIGTGGSTVRRCASGPTRHQLGALPPRAQRAALIRFALIKLPAGSIRAGLWRAGSRGGLSCCRCSPACRAARTPSSRCLPASS